MSREYSKRLGVISDEQLQAALDRFGLGRLLQAEPAAGGLFGQNIMLTTTEGEFVFRGAPHWDHEGHDDWQLQKERLFSRLLYDSVTGFPVPWPYLIDERREIFPWHWAIVPRLPGRTIVEPWSGGFAPEARAQQASAIGAALAAIHMVTFPEAGTYNRATQTIEPLTVGYGEYVEQVVHTLLERCMHHSPATTPADVRWVESLIESSRPAFNEPWTPTLIHLDYSPSNVLLDDSDGTWRPTGVVDWMTAEIGDPEADLSRTLAHHRFHGSDDYLSFISAYRTFHPARPGFEERFPLFMLWERMLIWEYGQRNGGWFPEGMTLRRWIEPFTRMLVTPPQG